MAFSDYKNMAQAQIEFNITYHEENFIAASAVAPPQPFVEELAFNRTHMDVFSSEGARAEMIIFPILREAYKSYYDQYELWVQRAIAYDERLSGTPDYIVATKSPLGKTVLGFPLVIIAAAKRNDFEQGWGQCLAELVAAQQLNGDSHWPVYGIVTDDELWQFGQLIASIFTKNLGRYTVDKLAELFGALHFVFQAASQATATLKV